MESTFTSNKCCLCGFVCPSREVLHRHHVDNHTIEEMSMALLGHPLSSRHRFGENDKSQSQSSTGSSLKTSLVYSIPTTQLSSNTMSCGTVCSEAGARQRKMLKFYEKNDLGENMGLVEKLAHGNQPNTNGGGSETGEKEFDVEMCSTDNAKSIMEVDKACGIDCLNSQISLNCSSAVEKCTEEVMVSISEDQFSSQYLVRSSKSTTTSNIAVIMGSLAPRESRRQCDVKEKSNNGLRCCDFPKWLGSPKCDERHLTKVPTQKTSFDFLECTADCFSKSSNDINIRSQSNGDIFNSEAQQRDLSCKSNFCRESTSCAANGSLAHENNGARTFLDTRSRWQSSPLETKTIEVNNEENSSPHQKRKSSRTHHSSMNPDIGVHSYPQICCCESRASSDIPSTESNSLGCRNQSKISNILCHKETQTLVSMTLNNDNFPEPYEETASSNAEPGYVQPKPYCLSRSDAEDFLQGRSDAYEGDTRPDSLNVISFWTQNAAVKSDDAFTSSAALLPVPQKIMGQMMSDMADAEDGWPELGDDITLIDDEELLSSLDLFPSLLDDFVIELSTSEGTGALTVHNSDPGHAATLFSREMRTGVKKCLDAKTSFEPNGNISGDQGSKDVGVECKTNRFDPQSKGVLHSSEPECFDAKNRMTADRCAFELKFNDSESFNRCTCCSPSREDIGGEARNGCGFHVEKCHESNQHFSPKCQLKDFNDRKNVVEKESVNHISSKKLMKDVESVTNILKYECEKDDYGKRDLKLNQGSNLTHDDNIGERSHHDCPLESDAIRAGVLQHCDRPKIYEGQIFSRASRRGPYVKEYIENSNNAENNFNESGGTWHSEATSNTGSVYEIVKSSESDRIQCNETPALLTLLNGGKKHKESLQKKIMDENLSSEGNFQVSCTHASQINTVDLFENYSSTDESSSKNVNIIANEVTDPTQADEVISQPFPNFNVELLRPDSEARTVKNIPGFSNAKFHVENSRIAKNLNLTRTTRSSFFRGKSIFSLNYDCITTLAPSRRLISHDSNALSSSSSALSSKSDFDEIHFTTDVNEHRDPFADSILLCSRSESVQNTPMLSSSSDFITVTEENVSCNMELPSSSQSKIRTVNPAVKTRLGRIVKASQKSDFLYGAQRCHGIPNRRLSRKLVNEVSSKSNYVDTEAVRSVIEKKPIVLVRSETGKIQLKNAKLVTIPKGNVKQEILPGNLSPGGSLRQTASNLQLIKLMNFPKETTATPANCAASPEAVDFKNSRSEASNIMRIGAFSKASRQQNLAVANRRATPRGCSANHGRVCSYCGDVPSLLTLLRAEKHDHGHHKVCVRCNKGLYLKNLNSFRHPNFTEGRKTEKCPLCGIFVSNILRHSKRVHNQERVQCDICHDFVKKDCLKSHKNRKHGRISLIDCDHCGKTFKNAVSLREHLYRVRYKIKSVLESIFDGQ